MNMLNGMADAVIVLSDRAIRSAQLAARFIHLVMIGSTWRTRWMFFRVTLLLLSMSPVARNELIDDLLRRYE